MIINYSNTFQALDQFVFQFNRDQEIIGRKIRQSMLATAQHVIRVYGSFLIKSNKVTPVDPSNLPSLKINNKQLATITQASDRTMRRHIKRLLECGFLTKKIWHGSHHNYELFINPKILWINGVGYADKSTSNENSNEKCSVDNQCFKNNMESKCPHSDTNKKTYKRNNRIITVDKLQNNWQVNLDLNSRSTQKGTDKKTEKPKERCSLRLTNTEKTQKKTKKETKKTRRKDLLEKKARRKDAWRENTKSNEQNARKKQTSAKNMRIRVMREGKAPCDASRHAFLSKYVNELWGLAKKVLYKGVWLNKHQCDLGVSLLYQWYAPVADEKLEHVHSVYTSRIYLARDFVDRDPDNRFIKLPNEYFNPNAKGSFAGTMLWYKEAKKHKEGVKLKKILREEITKFRNYPCLTVFRECEQRLDKLQIPALLNEFYAAVIHPELKQ